MKARFKTYSEFTSAIKIVYRANNGVKIICWVKGKEYVVLETSFRPWNSDKTRNGFLVRLYIREVLGKHIIGKRMKRKEGYELLGHRCFYLEQFFIICNAEEWVNTQTGEITQKLLIVNAATHERPVKVFINQVQL
ncbi:MAG TPA: hypothetical protein PKI55_06305 [Chitinophagaceae bacterium]|nr:hypothetical protein [Chitinophagaceae bacterium]